MIKNRLSLLRAAAPLKMLAQRFGFLILVLAAIGIMVLNKTETAGVERISNFVIDIFAPVMDVISRPAEATNNAIQSIKELAALRDDNKRLRHENARLQVWKQSAQRLVAENKILSELLDYKPPPKTLKIAGRVIADSGGAFVRSMIVNVGRRDGVRKGQAVVTGAGLAGRVIIAGRRSSRVLLITDINSRVPVLLEESRDRAILSGDNSGSPRLIFLTETVPVKVGDKVVTSGHGGIFMPGLQVGRVKSIQSNLVKIATYVGFDHLENVRILDTGKVIKLPLSDQP